jgi:hypothetical protein
MPLVFLTVAAFFHALASTSDLFLLGELGLRALTFTLFAVEIVKSRVGFRASGRWLSVGGRGLLSIAGALMVWVAVRNVAGGTGQLGSLYDVVNPWGTVLILVAVLYWLDCVQLLASWKARAPAITALGLSASLALFAMMVLVYLGLLAGNTGKVAEGTGGLGLANTATNETGLLAICLLMLCLWIASPVSSPGRLLRVTATAADIMVVFMTRSRLSIAVAGVVLVLYFWSRLSARPHGRLTVAAGIAAALILFGTVGASIVRSRTAREVQLSRIAGGDRLVLWAGYGAAFASEAEARPTVWITGVSPVGLLGLYDLSELEKFDLQMPDGQPFYPVHSELLTSFLTGGVVGLLGWLLIWWQLLHFPYRRDRRAQAAGALMTLAAWFLADMVQYSPFAVTLLFFLLADSVDSSQQPGLHGGPAPQSGTP